MLSTHLTLFLKNIFELVERKNVGTEKSDENIMSHFIRFLMDVFKNSISIVDDMRLSEKFKASLVKDLLVICDDISKLTSHLKPEVEPIDSLRKVKVYDLKNEIFVGDTFTKNLFPNQSTQLSDYYWNSLDFVSFNVIQESDTRYNDFEKPVFKNEDLGKIQNIVNNKMQKTNNHVSGSIINNPKVKKSKNLVKEQTSAGNDQSCYPNESSSAGTISTCCTKQVSLTKYMLNEDLLKYYTVNNISVKNVDTLDGFDDKKSSHPCRYISIVHLNDWTVFNAGFAIEKMEFNSIFVEVTHYKCRLCLVNVDATVEGLNNHLQSPLHIEKLARDLIWITSLGICVQRVGIDLYKCSICRNTGAIEVMSEHFQSSTHKLSFVSAATSHSTIFNAIENAIENKEMNAEVLTNDFDKILHQHKVKLLEKQLSCDTCGDVKIPMSLYNLYTHVAGQRHWKSYFPLLKKKFVNLPKVGSDVNKTQRGFMKVYKSKGKCYCQICKVFVDGESVTAINSHINGYAHYKFLIMFLKDRKISAFVDLNECTKDEGEGLSIATAKPQDGLEGHNSCDRLKSSTRQKTNIDEPIIIHDNGSYIILNYNIAIDKYSWNGMKIFLDFFFCVLCSILVPISEGSMHIAKNSHKIRLGISSVNSKDLTRMVHTDFNSFCLVCGGVIQEKETTSHSLTEHHKTQVKQLQLQCENWKTDMNRSFIEDVFPNFSDEYHNTLMEILKQNHLIALNKGHSHNIFCKLCSQRLSVCSIQALYKHITCSGHFFAFVESMNMKWVMTEPKYVNGIMTSTTDNEISYCLICNSTLPSQSVTAHKTLGIHKYLLSIFVKNISDHLLEHADNTVTCGACDKKVCCGSFNMCTICEHIKGKLHIKKYLNILKEAFLNVNCEISLNLESSGIKRFHEIDISYCSTCNISFDGVSDENILQHTRSEIHYIFEYVFKKNEKK